MKISYFLFLVAICTFPKEGFVSDVLEDRSLSELISRCQIIVVAKPIYETIEPKSADQFFLKGTFEISRILANKTKRTDLKRTRQIKVFDANEASNQMIGDAIQKYGYNDPKHPIPSLIIPHYATSMTDAEEKSDQERILFLSTRTENGNDFRYTIDGGYESLANEKPIMLELKKLDLKANK